MVPDYREAMCGKHGCVEPVIGVVSWRVDSLPRVWSTNVCEMHRHEVQRIIKSEGKGITYQLTCFFSMRP